MDKHLQQTTHFMVIAGQDVPETPAIPSQSVIELRASFITEENRELLEAALAGDIVEVADALCDLQVVLDGAFNAYGVSPIKEVLMDEVYASNMSKFCYSEQECLDSIKQLMYKDGKLSADFNWKDYYRYEQMDARHWVVKNLKGKVQKGIHYFKPKIKNIVDSFIRSKG